MPQAERAVQFGAFKTLYTKNAAQKIDVNKPILLLSGKDDPVGDYGKSVEKLYDFYVNNVGVKTIKKVFYDGVRHEYLNDISREKAKKAAGREIGLPKGCGIKI